VSAPVVVVPETGAARRRPVPEAAPPVPRPERSPMAIVGRVAVALVLLGVLFAGYLVWASGLTEVRAQRLAFETFSELLPTGELDALNAPVPYGSPVALLVIPSIGLNQVVGEGTTGRELMNGPGHVPATPLPGEYGNAVVMGRAHSYGRPFAHLSSLKTGDEIQVTTGQGAFRYRVTRVALVAADDTSVYASGTQSSLTLVTSGPALAPSQHLVVSALLEGAPIGVATRPPALLRDGDLGAGMDPYGILGAVLWAAILAGGVWAGIRAYRRWPIRAAYIVAAPFLVFAAWQLFANLGSLLPGVW